MIEVVAGGCEVVVRRITDADLLGRHPDAIAHEAAILDALNATEVRSPTLIAVDPTGTHSGAPTLVMERLHGEAVMGTFGDDVASLADPLVAIHAVDPQVTDRRYAAYAPPDATRAPAWATDRGVWTAALAVARSNPTDGRTGFIHRDYHPANVVTTDDKVTGVIDWISACVGPQAIDAAHASVNLTLAHGPEVGRRFLAHCTAAGIATDQRWGVVDALDLLPFEKADAVVAAWRGPPGHDDVRQGLEAHLRMLLG